jgi:hypothetical protein
MRVHAIVLPFVFVVVLATAFGSSAARADASPGALPVALLPVAAERVSVEAMPQMARADDLLRRAVAARSDVRLLSKAQTAENLASVREMGIACAVDDAGCLGKVAVLVDVERLLVPILRIDGASTIVRVLVVDRTGRSADAQVTTTAAPNELELRTLVADALAATLAERASASLKPPTTLPAVDAPVASSPATGDGPRPIFLGGVVTASVGAVVCVAGTAGALAVDGMLAEPEDYSVRQSKLLVGQVLVGAAVVGGVAAIAGGSLLLANVVGD